MTGQDAATYLDQYIVKVKPEKRAEFDAINKKMVALNRRNKGDTWLASENMYGEANVVAVVSLRSGFGDAQKAFDLFMGALSKPAGAAAAEKDQIKMVWDARAKGGQKQTWLVSQSLVGLQGTSYHITRPLGLLDDLDGSATLSQVLGANRYKRYRKLLAENTSRRKSRSPALCRS